MKRMIFQAVMLSALISMLSCVKGGEDESYDSSFVLSEKLIAVGVEGGDFSVEYRIEGPREGNVASVAAGESWIHIGKVYNSTFSFSVDKNDSDDDRTGTIVLSSDGTRPVTIHVSQSKLSSGNPIYHRFAIDVTDITTSSATIKITPVDAAVKYLYTVVSKSDYEAYGAKKYIEARINQVLETSAIYGTPLDSFLSSGVFVNNNTSLSDNTTYYVAVFDLSFSQDGTPSYSGEIELREFTTEKATQVNMKFQLSMVGTMLGVTPSSNETYICDVTTKEIWDSYASPADLAKDYIATMKAYGYLEAFLYKGVKSIDFSDIMTVRGQEYAAYAVGYRLAATDSGLTTDVEYIIFTY